MIITKKIISDLRELYKNHRKWATIVSEQTKTAQDRNGNNSISFKRGKEMISVTEKELWKELYYGGFNTQAWEILSKKYPEIAEAHRNEAEFVAKLRDFTMKNMGFAFSEMSITDLIDLMMAVRKYELLRFFFIDRLISFYKCINKAFYDIFRKEEK